MIVREQPLLHFSITQNTLSLLISSWILLFFCLLPTVIFTQSINFNYLSVEDGLSQSTILCSMEDSKGYLWFGTADGLNRYNGYEFKVFRTNPNDKHSLIDNEIRALSEDSEGNIWVGTALGISKLGSIDNKFISYQHAKSDTNSLSNNYITEIYEDKLTKQIWIGTQNGLNLYNAENDNFTRYYQATNKVSFFDEQKVIAIGQTASNRLWLGFKNGLYFFGNNKLNDYKDLIGASSILQGEKINTLTLDQEKRFWIGTEKGLSLFEEDQKKITLKYPFKENEIKCVIATKDNSFWIGTNNGLSYLQDGKENKINLSFDLTNKVVHSLIEGKNGIIWIGTGSDLGQYNPLLAQFNTTQISNLTQTNFASNKVWAIEEGIKENILLGTENGLYQFDPVQKINSKVRLPINVQSIFAIAVVGEVIWLGTWNDGLIQYNTRTRLTKKYTTDANQKTSLNSNAIRSIKYDKEGNLWIGTTMGLHLFQESTGDFKQFLFHSKDGQNIKANSIVSIYPDNENILWLATEGGLVSFDKEKGEKIIFKNDSNKSNSLSHNFVRSIYKAKDNTLWVGTSRGLNKWLPKENGFESYGIQDGLPNDVIYSIIEDSENNLWLSTNKGISQFNPKANDFTNFDSNDGLQGNEFNTNAVYENREGVCYFGGTNGFNYFQPKTIKTNLTPPKVVISSIDILNKDSKNLLKKDIFPNQKIVLSHRDYFFSFHFAALNYTNSKKNEYQYKLEGFDLDWKDAGRERMATYTNLKKGNYTFRVKASNNNGVWNEEGASLDISITPPFWLTSWFAFLMTTSLISIILGIVHFRIKNVNRKNIELEQIVSERTADLQAQKEKLATSEALFRSFYEDSPVGICYIQPKKFKFLSQCNDQLAKMLGYEKEELEQLELYTLIHSSDFNSKVPKIQEAIAHKEDHLSFKDVRFIHKNGQIVFFNCFLSCHWTEQKKLEHIITLFIDETEELLAQQKLKQAEALLIQSNKMAALGQLTAGIAHEINNPVNFIYSGVNALKKNIKILLQITSKYDAIETAADFKQKKQEISKQKNAIGYDMVLEDIEGLLESIRTGSIRTGTIIKGLQTFSREDKMKVQTADIHEGLDATLQLLKKEINHNVIVEKHYDSSINKIECFPGELNQVFLNLFINAIHAFKNKGGLISITTTQKKEIISITIADNGMGIPPDILSRIFDPFFTTKAVGEGTGLGLSISYGIIQKHNGTISVDSQLGQGTSFQIELPKRQVETISNG